MGGVVRFRKEGLRLDQAVAEALGVSRARAQAWIAQGRVRVGERVVSKPAYRLKGEEVVVAPPEERPWVVPEDLPLAVLYEDEDMLVLNKPPGLLTHPAPGVYTGTVVNALLGRYFPLEEALVTGGAPSSCALASSTAWTRTRAGCWWWPSTGGPSRPSPRPSATAW